MEILSREFIRQFIVPFLTEGSRGFQSEYDTVTLVEIMLYRLKAGCQWRMIPLKQFFGETKISWETVYYFWNKWCKAGCWAAMWLNFLKVHKAFLDMASIQIDGSHTPAKRGGEAVAFQDRKAAKTTNALFLTDNQGVPLVMGAPQAGNHHDVFDIKVILTVMFNTLIECNIPLQGLFLNADPGFDAKIVETLCIEREIAPNIKPNGRGRTTPNTEPYEAGTHIFDPELYKHRAVVEHTNAWIDAFKALLVRFETSVCNWESLHYLAFVVIFNRKILKRQNQNQNQNQNKL